MRAILAEKPTIFDRVEKSSQKVSTCYIQMYMKSFSSVFKSASLLRTFATAPYVIRALPYAKNALAPVISENTLNCHYDGHHQTFA